MMTQLRNWGLCKTCSYRMLNRKLRNGRTEVRVIVGSSKSQLRVEFVLLAAASACSRPKPYLSSLPYLAACCCSHFLLVFSQDRTPRFWNGFPVVTFIEAIMISFVLFFLLLLGNGRSKDNIQVGEDRQEDEAYNSGGEHGGDGEGDFEEVEEGSGRREVKFNLIFVTWQISRMGKIQLEDSRCHSWPTCAAFLIQAETYIFLACRLHDVVQ